MSAVLVVSCNKVLVQKFELNQPRVVIGRSQRCDLVLQDRELSREHTEITKAGTVYKVADLGSRNGTDLNGQLITEAQALKDGDVITLGDYTLTFYSAGSAVPDDGAVDDMEDAATRFVGESDIKKAIADPEKKPKVTPSMICKVAIESGALKGEVHKKWEGDLTFGRGFNNNIIFPDDAVSTSHARIYLKDGHHYVEDLGSSNGTFVNSVRLREAQMLNHGDKIRIGISTMEYTAVDPAKQKKMRIRIALLAVVLFGGLAVAKVLQPEDQAEKFTQQGMAMLSRGNYEQATEYFGRALEVAPDYAEAKSGLSRARSEQEALDLLAEAERAAVEERYVDALDICNRVLRLHPNHRAAKDLLEVLDQVDKASVAIRAENWPAAIQLLERALESYPRSEVLLLRMAQAQSEQKARAALSDAQELLARQQFDEGRRRLADTAPDSTYYEETQALIELINKEEVAAKAYADAQDSFMNGYPEQALREIDKGLERHPTHAGLLAFKADIGMVTPLMEQVGQGRALLTSSDVPAIRTMIDACNNMMAIRAESEVVTRFKDSARELQRALRERLETISVEALERGNALRSAGNDREALQAYMLASQANPENREARIAGEAIRSEMVPLIEDRLRQALVSMELGQNDLAIEGLREVLGLAVPGDGFYERAERALERLQRR